LTQGHRPRIGRLGRSRAAASGKSRRPVAHVATRSRPGSYRSRAPPPPRDLPPDRASRFPGRQRQSPRDPGSGITKQSQISVMIMGRRFVPAATGCPAWVQTAIARNSEETSTCVAEGHTYHRSAANQAGSRTDEGLRKGQEHSHARRGARAGSCTGCCPSQMRHCVAVVGAPRPRPNQAANARHAHACAANDTPRPARPRTTTSPSSRLAAQNRGGGPVCTLGVTAPIRR
jgi:hypothetical protein